MKQNLKPAVNLTALVLAAGLLIGLVTGCKQKIDPKYNYKVEHLQQNIADDNYTLYETETLSGKDGETTSAAAKPYEGFTARAFNQAAIKTDGSTVVQIKYDRNIITLKLNLDGGTTTTPLTDGEGGTKLLKGKFGAKVELKNLKKGSDILDVWTPELPSTFPALPAETYTASWTDKYRITVKGDERINIPSDNIKIDPTPDKTWQDIKTHIESNVNLKSEWPGSDYGIYEWRLGGETGEKISDDYPIDKHLTVYAVTNYAKFNIDGTKIKLTDGKGYTGDKPRGKIIIRDDITEIEDGDGSKGAFKDCTEISSIKFPQALTKIGKNAFEGCTGLKSLDLSGCTSLTKIDHGAFSGCKGLTSISLPANLTTIGWYAFSGCTGLTSLDLSGCTSLTKIDHSAFYGCMGLTSISWPASLTTIDSHAFFGCTGLTSLDLSNCTNLTIIGQQVFNNCTNLTSISLPANLTTIYMGAFSDCTSLTSLDLSGCTSLTTIGESAFSDCTGLTSLDLSGCTSLTTIDYSAFKDCTGLTEVKLPANLTQIVARAFVGCTGLKSAVFADKNGWKVYGHGHSSTVTPINSSDLANKETAAKYLSKNVSDGGYCDLYWYKN